MNYTAPLNTGLNKDAGVLPVFHGVDAETMRDLMASAHTAQFQKGAILLAQATPPARYYVVMEGWCGASKGNAEGQESILQLFRRGDFLIEASLNGPGEINPMNYQALTQVQILSLAPAAMRHAMERSKTLTMNLLAVAVQRCRELRDHIEQLALHSAEERVGRFLLQMRFNTGPQGNDIVLPFDKSLVAAYLGIKPETLSRTLQLFRERGFVIERNHLTVPFRQALCDYCDAVTMQSCPFAHSGECTNSANNVAVVI